ncbi:MAG TPA: ABC transporter ATP-binding protein [Acidimicrobiales bacterium]|nr:ABC transporter ATP-binding protein [Acidimicrobiales bacterium]
MSLLDAAGVSKRFGGVLALDDVSLDVADGEAVGLVGPNGAGKTTFFNCLLGLLRPDSGQVIFKGQDLTRLPVHRRARLGIGRTFQRVELFAGLTVGDHLLIAERARTARGGLFSDVVGGGRPTDEERARVAEMLELVGLGGATDVPVEALSLGHARLLELGRALITDPDLLLLDEPSSGLDRVEALALAAVLKSTQEERHTALLLVEHDLEMVQRVVSRLFVLDFGSVLAAGPVAEVLGDQKVRHAYLGRGVA